MADYICSGMHAVGIKIPEERSRAPELERHRTNFYLIRDGKEYLSVYIGVGKEETLVSECGDKNQGETYSCSGIIRFEFSSSTGRFEAFKSDLVRVATTHPFYETGECLKLE